MSDVLASRFISSTPADQSVSKQVSDKSPSSVVELTRSEHQKASLNVSILESAAVIIGVKDDPLSLVLSTAIDRINELLTPELGVNAVQKLSESEFDVSPESTAERIASLSTAFYSAFKEQHSGEDEATVLSRFVDVISRGIEKGFGEARDILEGLEVLEGGIASDIDQTYELVQEKLAAFEAMISDMNELENSSPPKDEVDLN